MGRERVAIPATIEEAQASLEGLGKLLTAKSWERAAIVYAFTEPQQGRRSDLATSANDGGSWRLSVADFAALGIHGLKSHTTIDTYRQRWAEFGDPDIKPGDVVVLPDIDWPPTRTGTDGYEGEAGMTQTVQRMVEKHGPEPIARALSDIAPEAVGKVAAESPEGMRSFLDATKAPPLTGEARARHEQMREEIDLMFLPAAQAMSMVGEVRAVFAAWYKRDPETAETFLKWMKEAIADMEVSKEAAVSDEDIAAFIDQLS